MSLSLSDFQDFVLLWIQKRTGVHQGELRIYPAMVRHCLCCQVSGSYAESTNGLCVDCGGEQACLLCADVFAPTLESVGAFCPACWGGLETTWAELFANSSPGEAEGKIRSIVMTARPRLTGCGHRA